MTDTEKNGVLVVDKPSGMTSHAVVGRVRRRFGLKRVGHAGTLDPDATGVLVVMLGTATSASDYLMDHTKAYDAVMLLGQTTETEDSSGAVLTRSDSIPDAKAVAAACESFTGTISQIPPMYSALKVGGRKLVDLARRGETVERQPREVSVTLITVTATDDPRRWRLSVECSKGTYIRTLCADIGKALGCGAVMDSLRRTRSGCFTLDDAITPDELDAMTDSEAAARLIAPERIFDYPPLTLTGDALFYALNGVEVDCCDCFGDCGMRRVYDGDGEFFAIGAVGNGKIKLTKRF